MIALSRCRELLGAEGLVLTDSQVEERRAYFYGLAHLLIGVYRDRKPVRRA